MPNYLMMQVLDVGQGDSTIVQIDNDTKSPYRMMVDCGSMKGNATAEDTIFNALLMGFFGKIPTPPPDHLVIDDLYLTHADKDHYNLLRYICENDAQGRTVAFNQVTYGCNKEQYANNGNAEKNWTLNFLKNPKTAFSPLQGEIDAVDVFHRDQSIPLGGWVNLWVLAANAAGKNSSNGDYTNENSIVLMLEAAGHKIFLMGDSTKYTEDRIIAHYKSTSPDLLKKQPKKMCFLKVGHHGSNTSSSQGWLDAIHPDMSIISSDTKSFSAAGKGCGLPDEDKCTQLAKNLTNLPAGYEHGVVYYDRPKETFLRKDVGRLALCSTVKDVIRTFNAKNNKIELSGDGCSWTIWIEKGNGNVYYGWTGEVSDPVDGMKNGTVVWLNPPGSSE